MRCSFCTRTSSIDFPDMGLHFCDSCGKAYREGFEHGKVYESIRRRRATKGRSRA